MHNIPRMPYRDEIKDAKMLQTTKVVIRLKEYIEEKGISQRKLAAITGIRFATINEMCRQNMNYIQVDNIAVICQALECAPWDFITYEKMTREEIIEREEEIQRKYDAHKEAERKKAEKKAAKKKSEDK